MKFCPLEKLHHLHDGYIRALRVGGRDLLLIQEQGQPYIIANRCPHMDAPLTYASVQNGLLRCPMHGIEFDLQSGCARGGAAASLDSLEKFPIVYEGAMLGVML